MTKYHPYRETSVAIPLSRDWFCVVSQTIAATPPLFPVKWSIVIQRQALEGGHRRKNLPLKPIALFGGEKKTNKHKTHKHFSDGPCETIVPGAKPHLSQGQTGQSGDFVEFNKTAGLSQGRARLCPMDGSRLSEGQFLFVPNPFPQEIFMFIGFSCPSYGGRRTKQYCQWRYSGPLPQGPCHTKTLRSWSFAIVVAKHYGGSKTLRQGL